MECYERLAHLCADGGSQEAIAAALLEIDAYERDAYSPAADISSRVGLNGFETFAFWSAFSKACASYADAARLYRRFAALSSEEFCAAASPSSSKNTLLYRDASALCLRRQVRSFLDGVADDGEKLDVLCRELVINCELPMDGRAEGRRAVAVLGNTHAVIVSAPENVAAHAAATLGTGLLRVELPLLLAERDFAETAHEILCRCMLDESALLLAGYEKTGAHDAAIRFFEQKMDVLFISGEAARPYSRNDVLFLRQPMAGEKEWRAAALGLAMSDKIDFPRLAEYRVTARDASRILREAALLAVYDGANEITMREIERAYAYAFSKTT